MLFDKAVLFFKKYKKKLSLQEATLCSKLAIVHSCNLAQMASLLLNLFLVVPVVCSGLLHFI